MRVDLGSGSYAFKCLPSDTDAVTGPTVTRRRATSRRGPAAAAGHRARPDPADPRLPEVDRRPDRRTRPRHRRVEGRHRPRRPGRRPRRLADRAPGVRADGRRLRHVRRRGRGDQRHRGPDRGRAPGTRTSPASTASSTACGTASRPASLRAPAARLDAAVQRARRLLAAGADGSRGHGPAGARDRRERRAVRADRPHRLRQRHQSGHRSANLDGTREVLALAAPAARGPRPAAGRARRRARPHRAHLDGLDHGGDLDAAGRSDRGQREQVNADFGDLLEQLAPVAAIFDVRRTA